MSDLEKSSGSVSESESSIKSSSESCICDVLVGLGYWTDPDAAVYVVNMGTCDLVFNASSDNPLAALDPNTAVPLPPLALVTIDVSVPEGQSLGGTTVFIDTGHCGIYSYYIGTTSPPDP